MPDILPALANRRARRAFDSKPIPRDALDLLWKAISVAPSHGNSQTTRILVAESPPIREALIGALSEGNRGWASHAPLLIGVACATWQAAPMKNSDGSERDLTPFGAGLACGNLLAEATELGLTAHPMAGFDEVAARAAFDAPPELRVMVVIAIGYPGDPAMLPEDLRARETTSQERIPLSNLLVIDRWEDEHGVSARDLRNRARA